MRESCPTSLYPNSGTTRLLGGKLLESLVDYLAIRHNIFLELDSGSDDREA